MAKNNGIWKLAPIQWALESSHIPSEVEEIQLSSTLSTFMSHLMQLLCTQTFLINPQQLQELESDLWHMLCQR